jgi:cell division protein FtsB
MIPKKIKKRKADSSLFFTVTLGLVCLTAIVFLVASNWKMGQRTGTLNSQVENLKAQINDLEQKKADLENGISQSQSQEYPEQVARNDLNMQKPGEEALVVKGEATTTEETQEVPKNFWEKIWDKFF